MKVTRTHAAVLAAASALAITAFPALAQEDTATDTTSETVVEEGDITTTREEHRAEHEAEFAAALADELGLDEDTVATAVADVREALRAEHQAERALQMQERLDEAVANGDLTQEQADAIADAAESGVLPMGGRRGHGGPGGPGGPGFGAPVTDDAA